MLHLVRHAKPLIRQDQPAAEWRMDPDDDGGIDRLRTSGALPPGPARWASSTEPKAVATARALTSLPMTLRPDLREAERTNAWFPDPAAFRQAVMRALANPEVSAVEGWEPLSRTHERVCSAVKQLVLEAAGSDVVVVGHGTAWTLVVAEITGKSPDASAWASMSMPDHCCVEPESHSIRSPWGAWRTQG